MTTPDLSEARRLIGAGMHLVELVPFSKRPAGDDWNHRRATGVDPNATGYGILLAENKLCSIDPDNYEQAVVGLRALGLDLDRLMAAGVRTSSTRPGSGGRSTFAAEGGLAWLKFSSPAGTAIEFRAESPNLQDCVPGVVYRDKAGNLCTQRYVNGKRLDDAPPLPDDLYAWWQRCSNDVEYLRDQQAKFFAAIGQTPHLAISVGKVTRLAFEAPDHRRAFNTAHDVESILERHGYTYDRRTKRWAPPTATGAAGVRLIPGKTDLWRSDHASDPLHGTFDAWAAFVVLDHGGDVERAKQAFTPPDFRPPEDDRFPPIDVYADDDHRGEGEPVVVDVSRASAAAAVSGDAVELMTFNTDELLGPIAPERELLPGIPAEAYTVIAGGLASAKTTLLHSLHLTRATGYDFLRLAETGVDAGPNVLVSYEDTDRRIVRRFQILAQHQHQIIRETHGSAAAREYLARLTGNLRRVTLTGKSGTGIVCRGHNGNVVPNFALLDELIAKVREFASSDVLIGLDPLRLAIVGSQSDDDGADVVVHVLNDLASRLPNSALVIPSHTTKAGAIEPGRSQAAAAYSTAGSALYSQHARSNFLMSRLAADEAHKMCPGDEVTREEIEAQRVVQLTHARLSHGPESRPRLYVMRGGVLIPVRANATELPLAELARRSLAAIQDAIIDIEGRGLTVSRKALEGVVGVARTRAERRAFVEEAIAQGWLIEAGSTSNKRIELTPTGRAQLSPGSIGESCGKAA